MHVRRLSIARTVARTITYLALPTVVLMGCVPAGEPSTAIEPMPRTISFENTSNSVVRVFLVSSSAEWLLGRVQPAELVQLRLPPGVALDRHESVALSVVPLGTISPGGGRATARSGSLLSPNYPVDQLLAMRWGVSGAQVYSVIRSY